MSKFSAIEYDCLCDSLHSPVNWTPRQRRLFVAGATWEDHNEAKWTGDGTAPPDCEPPGWKRAQVEAFAASLETKETTGFGLATFPFAEPSDAGDALALRLWQTATTDAQRQKAAEIGGCGKTVWVALDDEGPTTIRNTCKHRGCPRCSGARGKQIGDALTMLMDGWHRTKFVTLTRKPRAASLRQTVQSLLRDFNSLRRSALWKACVGQGAYTVEITRAAQRTHWHVHLHVLCDARYIPQAALSEAWKKITKDSGIVWVKAAKPSDARYLAKYVAKGNTAEMADWELWPYQNELHGLRLCATFGGAPSFTDLKPEPRHTLIGTLEEVQRWAREGDGWAQDLLARILDRQLRPDVDHAGQSAHGPPQ